MGVGGVLWQKLFTKQQMLLYSEISQQIEEALPWNLLQGQQMIDSMDFGDPLTFSVAPTVGQSFSYA